MTAPAALDGWPAIDPEERDPVAVRRPVSTFVGLVVVVAVLLGALGLSGAASPRLEVPGWADSVLASGERIWTVEVHNTGMAPVEVEAATWPVDGLAEAELLLVRPGRQHMAAGGDRSDATSFAPFRLAGGETRTVMLRGRPQCPPGGFALPVDVGGLTLEARSVLGRRQSIDIGSGPFGSPPRSPGMSSPSEPCP